LDRRRALSALAILAGSLAPTCARAQQGRIWRIAFLGAPTAASYAGRIAALRRGLAELGYVEGKNIVIDDLWADGKYEELPRLAAELVARKPDIIVASTTPPSRAAQRATTSIPIVMTGVADPIASGLVASLARPGANITGIANYVGDSSTKQLELLAAILARPSRIVVLFNPDNPSMPGLLKSIGASSGKLGVRTVPVAARTAAEIEKLSAVLKHERADGLAVLAEPFFFQHRVLLGNLAAKAGIPSSFNSRDYLYAGGLISYGSDNDELHRRAAIYVDRILKGAKPGDLAVEQAQKLEFVINLKAAKALGLTIPASVLARADEVIQ